MVQPALSHKSVNTSQPFTPVLAAEVKSALKGLKGRMLVAEERGFEFSGPVSSAKVTKEQATIFYMLETNGSRKRTNYMFALDWGKVYVGADGTLSISIPYIGQVYVLPADNHNTLPAPSDEGEDDPRGL